MSYQNAVLRIVIATAALAAAALPAKAQDAMPVFGAINIAYGETLRVNIANLNDPAAPPDPCHVQINFLNADGVNVRTASLTINNGQIGWVNLNFGDASRFRPTVNVDSPLRVALRPVANTLPPPCRAITAEIYETDSGRTSQYIPPIFLPAVQTNANSPLSQ